MQRDFAIGGYTVAQAPNPPLWVALAALLVAALVGDGTVHDVARAVFYVAISIWAYEEAVHGVNGFRKALGIIGLVLIVIAVARAIS